jgi:aminopeptidase N
MYRKELFGYTAPHNPMEVRQLAFGIIAEVFTYPSDTLRDLVNAAVHPAWQFRQFARNILRDQLGDETQRQKLELILDELRGDEQLYLSKELSRK